MNILTLTTHSNDIVLDFFLGSGTTSAVAMKMGRRFIGVEQLDYIKTISIERLKKVIVGEQGGVSSDLNWKGGGSFVYCELAKCNQNYVEEIEAANTKEAMKDILERVLKTGFISVKVKPSDIGSSINDFANLDLDDQKRFVMELLDKNMLYVNLSDLDDEEYAISEEDKAFNRSFYGLEG